MNKSTLLFPDSDSDDDDKRLVIKQEQSSSSPKKKNFNNGNISGQTKPSTSFQINNNYAERYDNWRNKEELMKMKARHGTTNPDDLENDSESESSSDDLDDWTEEKEKEFFKTLSNLKKKDPKIYDHNVHFFQQDKDTSLADGAKKDKPKSKDNKPFLLKDHERTMILEKGGLLSDDEDEEKPRETLPYYQELDSIKKGFTEALKNIKEEDIEDENEGFLIKGKPKDPQEADKEEDDYKKWLKGEIEKLEGGKLSKDEQKELGFLRNYWNDEKLDDGEKFLRDYILDKGHIDTLEIKIKQEKVDDDPLMLDKEGLSDDEQFETHRETFEHKYNFRFEEPDPEFIKRFPRTVEDSLRREDERRKLQRESAKQRKQDAKDRKQEEVQRLKALKRKEIIQKLKTLESVAGFDQTQEVDLEALDLDGDFDPSEYDKKMHKVFGENYYGKDEDTEKPQFEYDPNIDDEVNWEEWAPNTEEEDIENASSSKKKSKTKQSANVLGKEDDDEAKPSTSKKMSLEDEMINASSSSSKKSKKSTSKFLEVLERPKPKFNPELHKSFEEYFSEYYALDFEDLVGDLPTRFRYRKVQPNDFGLTTKEILEADDKELNQWASLKKTYQYRADDEEKYEAQAYQKKGQNENLKKKLLHSLYKPNKTDKDSDDDDDDEEKEPAEDSTIVNDEVNENGNEKKSKRKRKKKKKNRGRTTNNANDEVDENPEVNENPNDTTAVDIPAVAVEKKKTKKKNKSNVPPQEDTLSESQQTIQNQEEKSKNSTDKRKRKRPHKNDEVGDVEDDRLAAYGLNPKKFKKWKKYGGASK